ncbi:MAG: hypothetical protein QGH76_07015 [Phycisphaerales bacterium]|jgi:hypothetical protein|nr:hypothetical protein [Phycisphaerales bacterium]
MFEVAVVVVMQMAMAIPPLSEGEWQRLSAVKDGVDSRDEGFAALVDHVRRWPKGNEEAPAANVHAMISDPAAFRGDLVTVAGHLEQQHRLGSPWGDVVEWFVRDGDTAMAVYVVDAGEDAMPLGGFVQVPGRFYKVMTLRGRDGVERPFAAFVAPAGALATTGGSTLPPLGWVVPLAMVSAFTLFMLVLAWSRRAKKPRRVRVPWTSGDVMNAAEDACTELPDDPADALAELHTRAGADL